MAQSAEEDGERRVSFDKLLGEIRPKLHRYCSRMAGSAVDGEDIVQDVLMKAVEAFRRRADRQYRKLALQDCTQPRNGLPPSPEASR